MTAPPRYLLATCGHCNRFGQLCEELLCRRCLARERRTAVWRRREYRRHGRTLAAALLPWLRRAFWIPAALSNSEAVQIIGYILVIAAIGYGFLWMYPQ